MTTAQLRELLSTCPDNATVVLQIGDMRIADLSDIQIIDASSIAEDGSASLVALRAKQEVTVTLIVDGR